MSHIVARERMAPLELTVAAVAAAIVAAQVWFLAAWLTVGLAREINGALRHDGSCPDGTALTITRQGEIACTPPGMRLPPGWTMISPAS